MHVLKLQSMGIPSDLKAELFAFLGKGFFEFAPLIHKAGGITYTNT